MRLTKLIFINLVLLVFVCFIGIREASSTPHSMQINCEAPKSIIHLRTKDGRIVTKCKFLKKNVRQNMIQNKLMDV